MFAWIIIIIAQVVLVAASATSLHSSKVPSSPQVQELHSWHIASSSESCPYAPPSRPVRVEAPCTVVGCLLNAGAILGFHHRTDVFLGKNLELLDKNVFSVPFTYTTTFSLQSSPRAIDGDGSAGIVLLRLHGINYRAVIVLNGHVLTTGNETVGALRRFELRLPSRILRHANDGVGNNTLSITVSPPLNSWTTDLAMSFLDWSPFPADLNMGLWLPVEVVEHPADNAVPLSVEGVVVQTELQDSQRKVARLSTSFILNNYGMAESQTAAAPLVLDFNCGDANVSAMPRGVVLEWKAVMRQCNESAIPPHPDLPASLQPRLSCRVNVTWHTHEALSIRSPLLWWPWQLGPQHLFSLCVWAEGRADRQLLANVTYGMRHVATRFTPGGALRFFVNGRPLLIRGAGWAPDLFLRWRTPDDHEAPAYHRVAQELRMMRNANLNTIRLEGKPEHHEFFDAADRLGMLVLFGVECCTSWQQWPTWTDAMTQIAVASVRAQVRRLAHHPSVAAFFASSDELPPPQIESLYLAVFRNESWPNPVVSSAAERTSTLTGPSGVRMTGPYSFVPPTYFMADKDPQVAGGAMNFGGAFGFLTEGGPGESPMTFGAWNRTVPAEHQWNATDNVNSSLGTWWSAHMGNPRGRFSSLQPFTEALNARYGVSANAEQFCRRAQASTYETMRAMYEAYSRMKHVNATGIINWMANNAFPEHLWNLYSYWLIGGGGYFGAKRACEPLHAMLDPTTGSVSLINSLGEGITDVVRVTVEALQIVDHDNSSGSTPAPVRMRLWQSGTVELAAGVPADAVLELGALRVPLTVLRDELMARSAGVAATMLIKLSWEMLGPRNTSAIRGEGARVGWYWISTELDVLNWTASNGFRTPCTHWANYSDLLVLPNAQLAVEVTSRSTPCGWSVTLRNMSPFVAFFLELRLVDARTGYDVAPVHFSDNFVTLDALGHAPHDSAHVDALVDAPDPYCALHAPHLVLAVAQFNSEAAQWIPL